MPKPIKISFLKLIFFDKGKPSLKRFAGAVITTNALLGKDALCAVAMFHEVKNFSIIDASLDSLLYCGVGLLISSVIDKWAPNDKTTTNSSGRDSLDNSAGL